MFNQMLIWVGINALSPFIFRNIDWRAHVGGLLAGIVIHQLWLRILPERQDARVMRTLVAVAVAVISLAAIAFL